jgi:uroporphyrinogen decarboxylase
LSPIYNHSFHNALQRKEQSIPPIWMMRQAGRYHSHYQQLKQKYTFEQLCREPNLACEVTLGPIQEFDFDVAILFSDILFPLDFLGMELSFSPGPVFEKNLTKSMLDNMEISAFEEYIQFQHQALQNIRSALPSNKSLIGFTGGPITLYHFAIRNNPIADNLFEQALPVLQKLIEKNIAIQFKNDIDLLMIFDTEANQLTDQEFQDFCLPFIKQIADQYPNQIGYFTKNISPNKFELLKKISNLQLTVLGTQHNIFKELSQTNLSLQGNFSNDLLTIPEKSDFLSALDEYIDLCKSYDVSQRAGWIASLDHGVQKITPETNIHLFIDQIRTKLA